MKYIRPLFLSTNSRIKNQHQLQNVVVVVVPSRNVARCRGQRQWQWQWHVAGQGCPGPHSNANAAASRPYDRQHQQDAAGGGGCSHNSRRAICCLIQLAGWKIPRYSRARSVLSLYLNLIRSCWLLSLARALKYRCQTSLANVLFNAGSPPAWTPPVEDTKLKPDSGDVFRDINAARYSSYPLEPAFRALKAMEPQFDLQSVDIVGCGSTMGNLLRFAASQSKPFRFDVDVIGDTVLFVRRENSPTELIMGIQGYGHTFPEAYTTWDADVRNSCSHQRIVQYEFGGLKFLVRSETDGYVKDPRLDILKRPQATEPQSLDDALGSVALGYNVVNAGQQLEVRFQGTKVPQGQIFDLKTRRSNTQFDMEEILPRLWVNQTSKFVIAYHKFGVFDNPKVEDVRRQVSDWESRNSTLLARFHAIIKRIVDVVRDSKDQQCEVSWDGEGLLRVTKQIGEGRKALPSNVAQSFEL
jgi:hypothetical protein